MKIQTCKYVSASEIFKDLGLAWDVFINSDPQCTWGDNNRSLVTGDVIINALEQSDIDAKQGLQVARVCKRLDSLEPEVYVDLES